VRWELDECGVPADRERTGRDVRKEQATRARQNGEGHKDADRVRPADEAPPLEEQLPLLGVARPPVPAVPAPPAAPAGEPLWPPAQDGTLPAGAPERLPAPPLKPSGPPPMPPASRSGLPGPPPMTPWGWAFALGGLAVAFGPEVLLYLAALSMNVSTSTATRVSVGSAAALAVGSLIMYGWQTFAAWLFSLRLRGNTLAAWGFRRPTSAFFWTIPLALVAVYAVSTVHDAIIHPKQQQIIGEFPHNAAGIALFVLVAVVMAPLFEEIFFRGFLFQGLAQSFGWVWGATGSAAVFAAAHLQLSVFVPLFALGFGLAWVFKRTGSLWANIALHSLFNAISVVAWALLTKLSRAACRRTQPRSVGLRSSRQWQSSSAGRPARAARRMRPMSPASSRKICASTSCCHSCTTPSP
jgi:uncharacterized protein